MQTWDEILATAVIGTEQREFKLAASEDELGRLLAQISNTDREGSLLSAASVVALYRSAGVTPTTDTQPLPEAHRDDEMSRGSSATGQHLALMLEGEFRAVLPEWLAAMQRANKRVPEEHLPALLDFGRMEPSLRGMVVAVLGRRGEWLAAQNPEWTYAIRREDKDVWETGSREERLLLLERLRSVEPARAREFLARTWSQEPVRDRVGFLEKLATGLSSSDEPFLNELLHDRGVEVRRAARVMLAGLADSEFSRRLKQLANQVVSFKKPLIGKARIEATLPEDPIAWLKANDIEIDNPPRNAAQSMGAKGWALKELISLIPITHWSELWKKTPIEIIRAGEESEWQESFAAGFVAAARRDKEPEWVEALISFTASDPKKAPLLELVPYLPATRLEVLSLRALKAVSDGLSDGHPAFHLLIGHRSLWSDQLSRAVVNSVKKRINQGKDNIVDWQTKISLKHFAMHVSPDLYDELSLAWPLESESWPGWSKGVDVFQSLLAFRRDMHRAISEKEQTS
ncbi:MAG TPA: DUF5691 domain-containing protein [Pyrinomonadaceae bacterium]|nr:DUF5691 domain-containing protein [Pyrinomonadaceae bacterium]